MCQYKWKSDPVKMENNLILPTALHYKHMNSEKYIDSRLVNKMTTFLFSAFKTATWNM